MAKGEVMSRLTSSTITFAVVVFLSVPHLSTASEDEQRVRARALDLGRTTSAPARSEPTTRSAPTPSPGAHSGGKRTPVTRSVNRVTRRARVAQLKAEAPRQTSRKLSRRAPIVRNAGWNATVNTGQKSETKSPTRAVKRTTPLASGATSIDSTRTRNRAPASSRVRRHTRASGEHSSRAVLRQRVMGAARASAARPSRRRGGAGNVVGAAVPRATLDETFSSGGRGYVSWRGRMSSYGHRYPHGGGRMRFGRSVRHNVRGHFPNYSYEPRFYGASYFPHYGFSIGFSFESGSAFGHYGYRRYRYPRYEYFPYDRPYYPYGYRQRVANPYMGSLRLQVKPRDAKVFLDGYYVGLVDSFDGFTQRLRLKEGTYQVEISHPDYLPIDLDVLIVAGETVTFKERMVRP